MYGCLLASMCTRELGQRKWWLYSFKCLAQVPGTNIRECIFFDKKWNYIVYSHLMNFCLCGFGLAVRQHKDIYTGHKNIFHTNS
jgi:hypothetical protein